MNRSIVLLIFAALVLAAPSSYGQRDPANDIVCPADLDYQGCVDGGYFNHFGSGQGGGGGSGGYCQNVRLAGVMSQYYCNGQPAECPSFYCIGSPGSGQYCQNSNYTCPCRIGQQPLLENCD
jgi:hypothetical protein